MRTHLATDNGKHSAEKWANVTAEMIFDIDESVESDRLLDAKRVQLGIAMALVNVFRTHADKELAALALDENHCDQPHNVSVEELASILNLIASCGATSPWADKLASDEWKQVATQVIGSNLATVQHIERLQHADDTDNQSAKRYKAKFHGIS